MLHNQPMARRIKKSTFKDFINNAASVLLVTVMGGYCMYLIDQLPLPL